MANLAEIGGNMKRRAGHRHPWLVFKAKRVALTALAPGLSHESRMQFLKKFGIKFSGLIRIDPALVQQVLYNHLESLVF